MTDVIQDAFSSRLFQLSFLLPNSLGALSKVTRILDRSEIRICSITILDAADHSVVRLIVDRPGRAEKSLSNAGYSVFETELLGVVPTGRPGSGIRGILQVLLQAEIDIRYVQSVMMFERGEAALAVYVDDPPAAARVLAEQGLELIGHDDLCPAP